MPKAKRKNGLFDFLKTKTTVYHVKPRRTAKIKSASHLSASIRKLGSHKIVKVGDHYEVPSLDRGSWFDTRDEAQRFIREMKKYNPKPLTKAQAKLKAKQAAALNNRPFKVIRVTYSGGATGYDITPVTPRKRNASLGLPSNQFVNAKVRMKGGKIQVMADERILGKAGFKAGAGLKGVSVSGGAKLNPSYRKTKKAAKKAQRAGLLDAGPMFQKWRKHAKVSKRGKKRK